MVAAASIAPIPTKANTNASARALLLTVKTLVVPQRSRTPQRGPGTGSAQGHAGGRPGRVTGRSCPQKENRHGREAMPVVVLAGRVLLNRGRVGADGEGLRRKNRRRGVVLPDGALLVGRERAAARRRRQRGRRRVVVRARGRATRRRRHQHGVTC